MCEIVIRLLVGYTGAGAAPLARLLHPFTIRSLALCVRPTDRPIGESYFGGFGVSQKPCLRQSLLASVAAKARS